jgi:hypothetical protein
MEKKLESPPVPEFKQGWRYWLWTKAVWWHSLLLDQDWDPDKALADAERFNETDHFFLERDKANEQQMDIQWYLDQDPQAQRVDLVPKYDPDKLRKLHEEHNVPPPEPLVPKWMFDRLLYARTGGSLRRITPKVMTEAFAAVLGVASNEISSDKIGALILNNAHHITKGQEALFSQEIELPHEVEGVSVALKLKENTGSIPSTQFKITYPTLTQAQVKKMADIYKHYYHVIDPIVQENTLILEAEVVLDKVLPLIKKGKLPLYINDPKTLKQIQEETPNLGRFKQ